MPRGRKVGSGRDRHQYLRVRVNEDEMAAIDRARGESTRSDWVRDTLSRAWKRRRG